MGWNAQQITHVAVASAPEDYAAFETIGLSEIPNARVLDMGCFDGFNTILKFTPYANISEIVGVDPGAEYLEKARKGTEDSRFTWIQAESETFDGADESFDLVYFSHVFQHVADKEKTLKNVFRMLKPHGWVIIKTFDDSSKISYPDPENVMRRLFSLYEDEIRPRVPHTEHTDRNNGKKCYTLLKHAGFESIDVRIFTTDTTNKSLEERLALFERFTYFRQKTPAGVPDEIAQRQKQLLAAWKELFKKDDYYHASNTFVVIARKPGSPDIVASQEKTDDFELLSFKTRTGDSYTIGPMSEQDLGSVMQIEISAFPDPWTPVAYAMDIRHNPNARYSVLKDSDGIVCAFLGWWKAGDRSTLMHIAVDSSHRKEGLGTALLEHACTRAHREGCTTMQLNVRRKNRAARSFYTSFGFAELCVYESYYTAPTDDALFMEIDLTRFV